MRMAVYGAGGIGGYFGGRLAQAGSDVHFIDRGAHLQALREHGLRVRSVKGDFTVQVPAWSRCWARPRRCCRCRTGSTTRRSSPRRLGRTT